MTTTLARVESFEVFDGHLAIDTPRLRTAKPVASRRRTTSVAASQWLVRKVVPRRGQPYEHRCPLASFEQITHAAEELGEQGFTLTTIAQHEDLPTTQAAVALAFMRERGILDVRYRRNYAATGSVHLDAMTKYWALAENACLRRQG